MNWNLNLNPDGSSREPYETALDEQGNGFDVEYAEVYADPVTGGEYLLEVAKVGGGTVGRRYAGDWNYAVSLPNGTVIVSGDDLRTGTPRYHSEATDDLWTFFVNRSQEHGYRAYPHV